MPFSLERHIPFLTWIRGYHSRLFRGDVVAGLTTGVMLIPQGMAYAMLAGLPPIYGLYAGTLPLMVYAFLGTSRQLVVGPVAIVSILIAGSVSEIAPSGTEEYIYYAIVLALWVGLLQLMMGILKLGFLVKNLTSEAISGFISAAAIIISFSQLKHLFGLSVEGGKMMDVIHHLSQNWNDVHLLTAIIGGLSMLILFAIKRSKRTIPGPLIVVVLGLIIVYFFGWHKEGVAIIRDIPSGLPSFVVPGIGLDKLGQLLPAAVTIAFVGFIQSIAVATVMQQRHQNYELDPDQELKALGMANLVGSFFQSFPVTGGFSRTAVNDQAGAQTNLSSMISALLVTVTLLFLTDVFYFLPKAVLAAIIMVAVLGLVDISGAKNLCRQDKMGFGVFLFTFLSTLILGIQEGILVGFAVSILFVLAKRYGIFNGNNA